MARSRTRPARPSSTSTPPPRVDRLRAEGIRLGLARGDRASALRLGGPPAAHAGSPWPIGRSGESMIHVAHVDLGAIRSRRAGPLTLLPRHGSLSFFVDPFFAREARPNPRDLCEGDDPGNWRIDYVPSPRGRPRLLPENETPIVVEPTVNLRTLPADGAAARTDPQRPGARGDLPEIDAGLRTLLGPQWSRLVFGEDPLVQLCGAPWWDFGDGWEDHRVLLQIDARLLPGACGFDAFQVRIRPEDLAAGRFGRARVGGLATMDEGGLPGFGRHDLRQVRAFAVGWGTDTPESDLCLAPWQLVRMITERCADEADLHALSEAAGVDVAALIEEVASCEVLAGRPGAFELEAAVLAITGAGADCAFLDVAQDHDALQMLTTRAPCPCGSGLTWPSCHPE
jgi:hypothetical protein